MRLQDLMLKSHPIWVGHGKYYVMFDNGYGASIISGLHSYSDEDNPYGLAVIDSKGVCYTSGITEDVIGYQTELQIDKLLARIEALPKPK